MSEPNTHDHFYPEDAPEPRPEYASVPSAPSAPSAMSPDDCPNDPYEFFNAMRDAFGPRGRRGGPHSPHRGHGHGPHGQGPHGRGHGGPRAGRGDVRSAILVLLSEGEMHGYQIIREIEDRSNGTWKPSPGSVYPTLQMLTDEGLVDVTEAGSRKSYHLTDEGQVAAKKASERPLPWNTPSAQASAKASGLPRAGAELAQAVSQVATSGTPKQTEATIKVLKDARRQIYGILAED